MRPLRFALAAAMALTALAAATGALADAPVTAVVTPLISSAQAPCTVTDARQIGEGKMSDGTEVKTYEVACQEGLGYVLLAKEHAKPEDQPTLYDCLTVSEPGPDGKPSQMACKLKANLNPVAALQPYATRAGAACAVNKVRLIGSNAKNIYIEVACQAGDGYVMILPTKVTGPAVNAEPCLALGGAGNIKCTLTTRDQQLSVVEPLVAASGKSCAIKDKRYVLTTTAMTNYYEVACADGKGFMITADRSGKFGEIIDCAKAGSAGGCTLTDARLTQTEEAATYTDLAKKAGFNCQVSQYSFYPSDRNTDVVELQCSNRPDGGVGVFPASGAPHVYDCLRILNRGVSACKLTPTSALYGKLTAQLKAKNGSKCIVSDARAMQAPSRDLVEVACSDGNPGYVLEYVGEADSPPLLSNCVQVKAIPGAACTFASNQIK